MATPHLGIVGLAVMGGNLARNFARHGVRVVAWNRTWRRTQALLAHDGTRLGITPVRSLRALVRALPRPRRILVMVQTGTAVDEVLAGLAPLLERGDVVVDGGNASYHDTDRRLAAHAGSGFAFVGMGVSGGAAGALHGPSLMPGGTRVAYRTLAPLLTRIAATADAGPCVTHCGRGSAGHFVKAVHNGLEYADMQLIAEAYDLLRYGLGLSTADAADALAGWNATTLPSYLMEITIEILRTRDDRGPGLLLDAVHDDAGRVGSGRLVPQAALELGVAVPTIAAAVDARVLSSLPELRTSLARRFGPAPVARRARPAVVRGVGEALLAAKICAYAQGFQLLATADATRGYGTDLAEVARIWTAGCIIRSPFLHEVRRALAQGPALLLADTRLARTLRAALPGWRATIQLAAGRGIALPAMSASLAYFDAIRRARLPTNLVQAQRDLFGAHGYRRRDRSGRFSSSWTGRGTHE